MSEPLFACIVCGTNQEEDVLIAGEGFAIVQCRRCQLARTTPPQYVTRSHYDAAPQMAERYAHNETKTRAYLRPLFQALEKQGVNGRLLDVGCSVGILVDEAGKRKFEAEGLDLDSNAIIYGREQGRCIYNASLKEWPCTDYDVICMSHTLEHIPDPLAFLEDCKAHLKRGGYLAVMVPCHTGLHPRSLRKLWYGWIPTQHYYHYSATALVGLFSRCGFEPVTIFQNSMDHRVGRDALKNVKNGIKSLIGYSVATLGAVGGQGDQLIGIARWRDGLPEGVL